MWVYLCFLCNRTFARLLLRVWSSSITRVVTKTTCYMWRVSHCWQWGVQDQMYRNQDQDLTSLQKWYTDQWLLQLTLAYSCLELVTACSAWNQCIDSSDWRLCCLENISSGRVHYTLLNLGWVSIKACYMGWWWLWLCISFVFGRLIPVCFVLSSTHTSTCQSTPINWWRHIKASDVTKWRLMCLLWLKVLTEKWLSVGWTSFMLLFNTRGSLLSCLVRRLFVWMMKNIIHYENNISYNMNDLVILVFNFSF